MSIGSIKSKYDNVGVIGIGLMGEPMAKHLQNDLGNLICYDISDDRVQNLVAHGVKKANSIEELLWQTDIVFISLPNKNSVQEVMDKVIQVARPGYIVINTSTISGSFAKTIAAKCSNKEIFYIDAPVTGGVKGAEMRELTFILSGSQDKCNEIEPLLNSMGDNIIYVGESGSASVMKMINQLLFFAGVLNLSEAVYFADQLNIDRAKLFEVISKGSGDSYAFQTRLVNNILPQNFNPGSKVTLALKDIEMIIEEIERLNLYLPLVNLLKKRLLAAKELGLTEKDISIMAEYYDEIINM